MATIGKTEKDLWSALEGLNDDLLDLHLPEAAVDEELKAMGIDPALLAKRGREFVVKAKEEERLSPVSACDCHLVPRPRPRDLPDPHCRRCLGSGEVACG